MSFKPSKHSANKCQIKIAGAPRYFSTTPSLHQKLWGAKINSYFEISPNLIRQLDSNQKMKGIP
jgi:hypothetical protein